MRVKLVDDATGESYPYPGTVVMRPKRPDSGQADGPDGTKETDAANSKEVELTGAEGEAELEHGTWTFEVEEDGQTIASRTEHIDHRFDSRQLVLSVEPHTVDVRVTGGPDRVPIPGATVEATVDDDVWRANVASDVDIDEWTESKPTDSDGSVQFEIPRSALTVSFTATDEDLPPAESECRVEQAVEEGVDLAIAAGSGAMRISTSTTTDRPWPGVDVRIEPISEAARAYTDEGTISTKSDGRRTVEGLPVGEYEVSATPALDTVDTTPAVERVTIEEDETVDVNLLIGISYTMSTETRDRIAELDARIEELATDPARDVAIPRYYGTVLASILELTEAIESAPERTAAAGVPPDAAVEALLDATERGLDAVSEAMSERRVAELLKTCAPMTPARVTWDGNATLDAFLTGVTGDRDDILEGFRDRVAETDEFLNRRWGDVNETAPARKLHDRLAELAAELDDTDDEFAVGAQAYVGVWLLDAIEELFEHDALVKRLNGRTL